ncbi:protein of unknown function [Methylacidimicrobium sp. AP8]|uniref:hypothetical protein n=1 Tax=Methylacidimicrobium sp. AP8 TaxID=2730359 RepID=UPI0018BFEAC4|nr:hypothetical protein [Methylacidimicrobium sp. AP8]CAB4243737.1 protein of unknown function [Methylacidimicrobium sp. AP8]
MVTATEEERAFHGNGEREAEPRTEAAAGTDVVVAAAIPDLSHSHRMILRHKRF